MNVRMTTTGIDGLTEALNIVATSVAPAAADAIAPVVFTLLAETAVKKRMIGFPAGRGKRKAQRAVYGPGVGTDGRLSVRSGRLARSLFDPQSSEGIRTVTHEGAVSTLAFGSTVEYARIHERGGRTGAGHRSLIPARPYLSESMRLALPRIVRMYDRELERLTRETFRAILRGRV